MHDRGYCRVPVYVGGKHGKPRTFAAYTLVDAQDHPDVAAHRWRLDSRGYVMQSGAYNVQLHRYLLRCEPGDGKEVDHRNGNKLDNRRDNLRLCTHTENTQNRPASVGSTSPFRAVYWARDKKRWRARPRVDGKYHHLGYFRFELDAAEAVDQFLRDHVPFSEPDPAYLRFRDAA